MPDYTVNIDVSKCIGCGLCARDCPSHVIKIKENKSTIISPVCLKCGHCIAVCPTKAVSIDGYDASEILEKGTKAHTLDADDLLDHLIFRRTIRHYKNVPVEKEKINKIIQAGRYTPSGGNRQNVRFIVVQDKIPELEDAGIAYFKKLKSVMTLFSSFKKLPYYLGKYKMERGFLFLGAPLLILAVSESDINASLATMSMELMAEAQGLRTVYTGLFIRAANSKNIRSLLNLEKNERVIAGLCIGYPDVTYLRSAPKKKAAVTEL